jgi:hypothetical protein
MNDLPPQILEPYEGNFGRLADPVRVAALNAAVALAASRPTMGTAEFTALASDFERFLAGDDQTPALTSDLTDLVQAGLTTDGAHHKQWYLEQVAKLMGLPVTGYEHGTAP